jgi:hypothetical protein
MHLGVGPVQMVLVSQRHAQEVQEGILQVLICSFAHLSRYSLIACFRKCLLSALPGIIQLLSVLHNMAHGRKW